MKLTRRTRPALLIATLLLPPLAAYPADSAPDASAGPSLEAYRPLAGDWVGEGAGAPGEATGGFSFSFTLLDKAVVRKNFADYPPAGGKPGFRHEDLMVLWPAEGGARATYWDNEGHHIDYHCTAAPGAWRCETQGARPAFRLEYLLAAPGALKVTFSISPGGSADGFKPYVTATARRASDPWAPLRPLVGTWEGTSQGQPGQGVVRREYRFVLGDRFLEVRNLCAYLPSQKNPKGEVREDLGYLSVDRRRGAFVLRQFHVEGLVNTSSAPLAPEKEGQLIFESEAIENLAPGWRERETVRLAGDGDLVEVLELAEPGKDFAPYTQVRLQRVRP
jgi:hypothetical protein